MTTVADLQPDPRNANKGTERGRHLLETSVSKLGTGRSILLDKNNKIVAGNKTVEVAAALGIENVRIIETDGTEIIAVKRINLDLDTEDGRLMAYADNRVSEIDLAFDVEQIIADVNAGLPLDDFWFESEIEEMIAGLVGDEPPAPGDAEPQTSRAEELRQQWQTETGQLWRLPSRDGKGEHRLIVGDCTDRVVVERVMGGDCAEMVWTDPPYGVAVGDKNKFLNSIARSNRVEENLENDTLDESGLWGMLCASFDNAMEFSLAGAAWYVAAPPGPLHVLFGQALKDRGIWRQTITWVKNNATFSPLGVCYHWQAEPIFFGWQPGAAHRFYGGRQQTTVWGIDRPLKSPEHPTMKPVELVERAIENSSQQRDIVFDFFIGSGTTLIACENLSRYCRAVEISPAYCAVILQRYQDAFGITPELIA